MADIFLSYSSRDRERVSPIRDALVDRGLSVFWDQEVPANTDWDTWIRARLNEARLAVVVWSSNSVVSDNVRHEAFVAKQQNKLLTVLIDALNADQLPMGFYTVQAANLTSWNGALDASEWLKVLTDVEARLTPAWLRRNIDQLEAELVGERARREASERRDRTLRDQIAKEAEARQRQRVELDEALQRVDELNELLGKVREDYSMAQSQLLELDARVSGLDEARRRAEEQLSANQNRRESQAVGDESEATRNRAKEVGTHDGRPSDLSQSTTKLQVVEAEAGPSPASPDELEERWRAWQAKGDNRRRILGRWLGGASG